ncbi:MAG: YdcF family protein [Clostridia bacterium]|nr:YdcF family protein [Clostridia bacterium]
MLASHINKDELTPEIIDRLIYKNIQDTGENADCIVVLGSTKASMYRVPKAAQAYKAGRAGKILLCGGVVRDFPDDRCTEAEHMRKAALALGVPEEDILSENASQNTIENILFALIELQRAFWLNKIKRVLLVTTYPHMRRSLAIARYLFPPHISVIPCPANDLYTRRDNWMNTPEGTDRVKNEALSIIRCIHNGVFPDLEI